MLICGYVARRGINTPGLGIAIIITLWEQCFNRSSETREETLSRDHLPITWAMHQSHELMTVPFIIQPLLPTVLGAEGICVSQPGRACPRQLTGSTACVCQVMPEASIPPFKTKRCIILMTN